MKFWIVRRCWWMFWADGMVVYPFVFIKPKTPSHWLWRHEFEHCYQVHRAGVWKFYTRYLMLLLRHGYFNHPDEQEARERQFEQLTDKELSWIRTGKVEI